MSEVSIDISSYYHDLLLFVFQLQYIGHCKIQIDYRILVSCSKLHCIRCIRDIVLWEMESSLLPSQCLSAVKSLYRQYHFTRLLFKFLYDLCFGDIWYTLCNANPIDKHANIWRSQEILPQLLQTNAHTWQFRSIDRLPEKRIKLRFLSGEQRYYLDGCICYWTRYALAFYVYLIINRCTAV